MAPDFFWRLEPGVELDPYAPSTGNRALALARRFDTDAGVRDVQATLDNSRALGPAGMKAGLVGYSLGARLTAFATVRTDMDAAWRTRAAGRRALACSEPDLIPSLS